MEYLNYIHTFIINNNYWITPTLITVGMITGYFYNIPLTFIIKFNYKPISEITLLSHNIQTLNTFINVKFNLGITKLSAFSFEFKCSVNSLVSTDILVPKENFNLTDLIPTYQALYNYSIILKNPELLSFLNNTAQTCYYLTSF